MTNKSQQILEELWNTLSRCDILKDEFKSEIYDLAERAVKESSDSITRTAIRAVKTGLVEKAMVFIEPHEGRRKQVYWDTMNHPTIGVGFNLDRGDAETILGSLGYNKSDIIRGKIMSDEDIDYIFRKDVEKSIEDAKKLFITFDKQPEKVQLILVDMIFNLGYGGLSKFVKMRGAVESGNYEKAADEMMDSRWYSQVGNRSKKLVEMMRSIGKGE